MTHEAIIHTEDLNRHFQSGHETLEILKDINLSVRQGTLTILKGRSGSGKTTLLNLLSGLDQPTSGDIWFENEEISRWPEHRKDQLRRYRMGFVFQSIALIASMTAWENVEFALRLSGYDRSMRKQRVEEVLELVGLEKRMKHRAQELSGGEQQRVAIARAIAHKPVVVFADEPTAELDMAMGLQIVNLFKTLIAKEGLTVIMTSHDPNMAALADEVFTLDERGLQA